MNQVSRDSEPATAQPYHRQARYWIQRHVAINVHHKPDHRAARFGFRRKAYGANSAVCRHEDYSGRDRDRQYAVQGVPALAFYPNPTRLTADNFQLHQAVRPLSPATDEVFLLPSTA